MIRNAMILAMTIFCSGLASFGQTDVWRDFELENTQLDGVTLYYEKLLSAQMTGISQVLSDFQKQEANRRAQVDTLRAKSDEIVEQVNKIVGFSPTKEQKANQVKILDEVMSIDARLFKSGQETTLYIVSQKSIKDHLRKGGSLPGFSYVRQNDQVDYHFALLDSSGAESRGQRTIVIPVPVEEAPRQLAAFLTALEDQQLAFMAGLALHEVTEATMVLHRLKGHSPYFRWFSDGFANAIAIHLLRKFVNEEAAEVFARFYDIGKHAVPPRQINLRYWMGLEYCLKLPLESEKELDLARYAYATFEAVSLIDKHGIGCVARILDVASEKQSDDVSQDLMLAIGQVAGEDMRERLLRYQAFETGEQGIRQYGEAYNAALARMDYLEALTHLIRIYELRGELDPMAYRNAAILLFRMGRENAGDQIMLGKADFCRQRGLESAYVAIHALFVDYAFECNNPKKAVASAEIVLTSNPNHVPSLAIRMVALRTSGDVEGAKKVAQRIIELEQSPQSRWRHIAEKFK
jgi:hypothetical protein